MIVPQNKNGNFFMLSNSIFKQGLKPREFIVYCCLVKHSDKNGICFPSRRLIAEECCIDKKTVDAAIISLEKSGLVKKKKRRRQDGSNTSNAYTVKLFR
jgi:DNA-binding MarR family transcriptional regulator